jgi:hypothetical protein
MAVNDGQVIFRHAGHRVDPPSGLTFGSTIAEAQWKHNILGRPYVWDEPTQSWVPLQPLGIAILQMWPAVPMGLLLFVIGATSRFLRTGNNPFNVIKPDKPKST